MPFGDVMKSYIFSYCIRDLPDDKWYEDSFDFVKNSALKAKLISEFKNARFIYKVLKG